METPPSIHLHIDRVILNGLPFTATDAAHIRAALETELARVLGERFPTASSASISLDTLPAMRLALNSAPGRVSFGREVATTLGTSLSETFAASLPAPTL